MTERVLAVLGTGLVDPARPILRADDLGALRGDGIFESMLVRAGEPWLLEQHLARLSRSALRMDLAAPSAADWRGLAVAVTAQWPVDGDGVLRLVCTRGPDADGPPTAYAILSAVPAETVRQRRQGIRVVTRSLGLPAQARRDAPWLLGGVKSTSYAVAMAVIRDARRHDADDVIWLSIDGGVLEGPTASVVWAVDSALYTIPAETGILDGTTAAYLFEQAPDLGFDTGTRFATIAELHAADAVWLVSSVRGAAAVRAIDGRERGDGGLTERIQTALALS